MTVPNSNSRSQTVLSVPNQTLPTDFYFLEKEDLKVISDINGTLVEDSGYSVNLPPAVGQQGEVVMIGGIAGEIITIINNLECNQLLDYVENDDFPAELHERGLDKLTMLICRLADDFDLRAIQYPITELTTNPFVPILADRIAGGAGTVFGWNAISGRPDVLSKGSLNLVLTLSNDSTLGGPGPDPVNGVTQAAVKTYIDLADASLQTVIDAIITASGLNANGTYKQPTTSNFINGSTGIDIALLQLDAEIDINRTASNANAAAISSLGISELVQNKDLAHTSSSPVANNQLDVAFAKSLETTARIQGESIVPMGSITTKPHLMNVRWSFVKVSTGPDVWDWTIIGGIAAGTADSDSQSASGTGLVATLPSMSVTGVGGATINYKITIIDLIVRGDLGFAANNFFEHNIVADIF